MAYAHEIQNVALVRDATSGVLSELNSNTTPLNSGQTYTGTWEKNTATDVMVSCKTDANCTLYFDFSNDGVNADTFPTAGFTVTANIHEFHIAVKGPRYFRPRVVNGAANQTYLRLYTYYGDFRKGNAPINFTIADDADAVVTKSVISGIGQTTASVTDNKALQVTMPPSGRTSFGETSVAQNSPEVELTFPYRVNSAIVETRENNSGNVTHDVNLIKISTGANTASSAAFLSKGISRYNPGIGILGRFTALFTTGVANSTQIMGIGNDGNFIGFGYNGTDFGILHSSNGTPEVRTLTVTTGSSTAENINITLNDVVTSVAVTNTGNVSLTANEIANGDYSNSGLGWSAYAKGDQVEFVSWSAEPLNANYSLGAASTAVGTFSRSVIGETSTENWIAQANWNAEDKFDGTGLTGITIDPTKGNVYQVRLQWLGYGAIQFFLEDADDAEYHLVHTIEYNNSNTVTNLRDPSFRIVGKVTNTTNNTDMILKSASSAIFKEGKSELTGLRYGINNSIGSITTTALPVVSFRMGLVDNGKHVKTTAKILSINAAVEHTKPMNIIIYSNPTLTGAKWSKAVTNVSSGEKDTDASAVTGGTILRVIPLGKSSSITLDFTEDKFAALVQPGDIITVAAQATSGTNGEAAVGISILEKI